MEKGSRPRKGQGRFNFFPSVVQRGRRPKLAHGSGLEGEPPERATDEPMDGPCQRTDRTRPQRTKEQSSDSKKPQPVAMKNICT
jgi:hypothetical protein